MYRTKAEYITKTEKQLDWQAAAIAFGLSAFAVASMSCTALLGIGPEKLRQEWDLARIQVGAKNLDVGSATIVDGQLGRYNVQLTERIDGKICYEIKRVSTNTSTPINACYSTSKPSGV